MIYVLKERFTAIFLAGSARNKGNRENKKEKWKNKK